MKRTSIRAWKATAGFHLAVIVLLFDNPLLAFPSSIVRRLPFSPGQVWHVHFEFDDQGSSHNGTAAFSWDSAAWTR